MSKSSSQFDENVKKFYEKADADGSGFLSCGELYNVLKQAGLSQEDTVAIFASIDKDGDRKITYKELETELKKRDPKSVEDSEMRAEFQKMDKDGSGHISCEELQEILTKHGKKGSAAKYIDCVDKDGDDKINYEEFLKMWKEDK